MSEERFPNVEWFCDNCGDNLNCQPGFNDHKYIWKCTACGFKNSISRTNIRTPNQRLVDDFLPVIDLLRTTSLHLIIIFFMLNSFGKSFAVLDENIKYCFALYPISICGFSLSTINFSTLPPSSASIFAASSSRYLR